MATLGGPQRHTHQAKTTIPTESYRNFGLDSELEDEQRRRNRIAVHALTELHMDFVAASDFAAKHGPDLFAHEKVHQQQYARYDDVAQYMVDYAVLSAVSWMRSRDAALENTFEAEANLWWGDYRQYPWGETDVPGFEDWCCA